MRDQYTTFDRNAFLTNFHGLEDLAFESIVAFVEVLPKMTAAIEGAIHSKSSADLLLAAHSLNGTLSSFHAERSMHMAWQLEQLCTDPLNAEAGKIFQELVPELEALVSDLNELGEELRPEKKTLLIVDDNEFDRALIMKALARKGNYQFLEAADGEHCLKIIGDHHVDLIIMDIMMPGELGTQILFEIRKTSNAIELPIIMVTARTDASDVVGCLQSGANDYIKKPVNFDIAASRISTHLKLAQLSRDMAKFKEIAALDAMVTTYQHEINNPLAIAIGCLSGPILKDEKEVERLRNALWRVADIVKKINVVSTKKKIEFQEYSKSKKMIKVS